ncbi:glycine--tRNA ligase subunit beta [Thiobacillus sp.]|uniref:glycine--tRNA ligase subunit beta n=1 Tax=Thiobacillus sp. TaxID=924 RepID=UPI00286EA911|nr:glycine--tRNA ligase subunit beta [Thiobacillus sp.]
MSTQNLLVELFVEELPPKALEELEINFCGSIELSLKRRGFLQDDSVKSEFASPRRLAVSITNVAAKAPDQKFRQKLMPVSVGLDSDGSPTPALVKKLASIDPTIDYKSLHREQDGKHEALFYEGIQPGLTLTVALQKALEDAIDNLPIPKVMTYPLADGWTTVNFVRPVHGLVALHGTDIVPVSVLGLTAGRDTHGHRFEARVSPVVLTSADSYAAQLKEEGAVIASFAERRADIVRQLQAAAAPLGFKPVDDDALLDEVTALVERPNVLVGTFETAYLDVPQECLILTMKANQKYFPLLDAQGKLTNQFLIVSNISPADASAVIEGNERVVRPRLADAKFFFDQDRKKALDSRVLGLAKVVYHNKLGTQGERVTRVQAIARAIGEQLGGEALALQADQAALLAKADLLTDMVGEFPELQGIMGRYYAQHDGLSDDIAFAIEDHYKPRFAGDELPRNTVGVCVALADKLETLVGMFSIGQIPTGDKDPFALRRHALGVLRILIEKNLKLDLPTLLWNPTGWTVSSLYKNFPGFDLARLAVELNDFLVDRLAGLLLEQSFTRNEISAIVLDEMLPERMDLLDKRLQAVRAFSALSESESLAAANKRVGNILKKVEGGIPTAIDPARFVEPAEMALADALEQIKPQADAAFEAGDYTGSLTALAALKAPVDAFFDSVMVNADDPALKANRLALLNQLHQTMNRVADLSRLAA